MKYKNGLQHDPEFVERQIDFVERKLDHIARALETCKDRIEADGLHQMQHAANLESAVVREIAAQQAAAEHAMPLEAVIMQQLVACKQEQARLSHNWHRGHGTPSAYWDAELRCLYLTHLLAEYHAWQHGRPLYPPVPDYGDAR